MEKEYYITDVICSDNYGVYDYLIESETENIKTFGVITDTEYIFKTGIYDHYGTATEIKDNYGEYDLYFSTYKKSNMMNCLNIYYTKRDINDKVNLFQLECVINALRECQKYCEEKEVKVEVSIPSFCFKDKEEITTTDLNKLINYILDYYYEIKKYKDDNDNLSRRGFFSRRRK